MVERRLRSKVAGRTAAREVFGLLAWEDGTGADYADSFLDEMRKLLPERRQPDPPKEISQAALNKTKIPFGQYKDQPLEDIPLDYLDWLCRSQEDFYYRLRMYLRLADGTAREGF